MLRRALFCVALAGAATAEADAQDDSWLMSSAVRCLLWSPSRELVHDQSWPDVAAFEKLWARRKTHWPYRVVDAHVRYESTDAHCTVVMGDYAARRSWWVSILPERNGGMAVQKLNRATGRGGWWKIARGHPVDESVLFANRSKLELTKIRAHPRESLPEPYRSTWVYTQTLMAANPDRPDDPQIPVGGCSQDKRPTRTAADQAIRALEKGRVGRFLRHRVMILGDHSAVSRTRTSDAACANPTPCRSPLRRSTSTASSWDSCCRSTRTGRDCAWGHPVWDAPSQLPVESTR
ncbi:MAG: hypothetical protein CMJ83_17485 [Planctomycetes bacterium]|nr:hypothetical protein [Planctomycetota bacterium]